MTLSDDDLPPVVAHRRELDLDRGSHHGIKSSPHRNLGDLHDSYLEVLAEDYRIKAADAAAALAKYEAVKRQRPERDMDDHSLPVVDGRCFDATSADTAEEWRSPSGRRSA